jgi:hypothetical protein
MLVLLAVSALPGLLPVAGAQADAPVSITTPTAGAILTGDQPTFSGTAGTAATDAPTVILDLYAGQSASGSPVQELSAPVSSGGSWAVAPSSPLADGVYTAVAGQSMGSAMSYSAAVSFTIKVNPPALTLWAPLPGATVPGTPTLFGVAGHAPGDLAQVVVALYAGEAAGGRPLRSLTAARSGDFWIAALRGRLPLGLLTAVIVQRDAAGHVATVRTTFLRVSAVRAIGDPLSLAQNGLLSVPVGCPTSPGFTAAACTGTVEVVTARTLRGLGRVRLLREPFSVPAGRQLVISGFAPHRAVRALRRTGPQPVEVTVTLAAGTVIQARRSLVAAR